MKEQLEQALVSARGSDQSTTREIQSLRRANMSLQDQLREALQSRREDEKSQTRQMVTLQGELETLRKDLANALSNANELEMERKRLIKEKMDSGKEKSLNGDAEIIDELSMRIKSLELENEKLKKQQVDDQVKLGDMATQVEAAAQQVLEYEKEMDNTKSLDYAFERQCELVRELTEQLELERGRNQNMSEEMYAMANSIASESKRIPVQRDADGKWRWSSWFDRSWVKIWERDIAGLREEVAISLPLFFIYFSRRSTTWPRTENKLC